MAELTLNKKQQEIVFKKIVEIYDLATVIIDTVEHPDTKNPKLSAKLASPIAETMGDSADKLIDNYMHFLENGQKATSKDINRVETAIRTVFHQAETFIEEVKNLPDIKESPKS